MDLRLEVARSKNLKWETPDVIESIITQCEGATGHSASITNLVVDPLMEYLVPPTEVLPPAASD